MNEKGIDPASIWQCMAREKIYQYKDRKTNYIELFKDKVKTPSGKTMYYTWYRSSDVVVIVPYLDDDTLVMINQYRYPLGKKLLEFPAGHVETGEDPAITASRELREETGYKANEIKCIYKYHPSVSKSKQVVYVFKATELIKGKARLDRTEDIHVLSLKVKELRNMIETKKIENAGTLIPFLLCCTEINLSRGRNRQNRIQRNRSK